MRFCGRATERAGGATAPGYVQGIGVGGHKHLIVQTAAGEIGFNVFSGIANNLMVSEPTLLAELLLQRCRSYA